MIHHFKKLFDYRELLMTFISKSLNSRYKGSFLGFLWTFVNPLAQLVIYTIAFQYIFHVPTKNYSMFLFCCLVPWTGFITSINGSINSISGNSSLVKKIFFPRELLPISISMTYIIDYIYCIPIILIAMLICKIPLTPFLLLLPVIIIIQYLFQTGIGFTASSLNVKFRDIQHTIRIITMAWLYLTPILYKIDMIPANAHLFGFTINAQTWLKILNPMAPVMLSYRDIFFYGQMPDLHFLFISLIEAILVYIIGYSIFSHFEKTFAEEL